MVNFLDAALHNMKSDLPNNLSNNIMPAACCESCFRTVPFLSLIQDSVKTLISFLTDSMKMFWSTVANEIERNKTILTDTQKLFIRPLRKTDRFPPLDFISWMWRQVLVAGLELVSLLRYEGVKASHKRDELNIHIHDTSKPRHGTKITAIPQEPPRKSS